MRKLSDIGKKIPKIGICDLFVTELEFFLIIQKHLWILRLVSC